MEKKKLCAHSSLSEVHAVQALLYCSCVCVCVHGPNCSSFVFIPKIYVMLSGVRQQRRCCLAALLSP